jgi:hypothetical protein
MVPHELRRSKNIKLPLEKSLFSTEAKNARMMMSG